MQEDYYEEEYQEDTHSTYSKYIIPYFAILAILMWPANAFGWGMMGILTVMGIAALVLGLCVLLFKYIKRKMGNVRLSRRQWVEMMSGMSASAPTVIDTDGSPLGEGIEEEAVLRPTRKLASTTALVALNEQGLPDRIIENNGLYLSDHFMPDVNTIFGQVVAIFGVRGFGKSNLLSVLAEELAPYHVPMLIVDTKDQYSPLADRRYLPRGYRMGSPDLKGQLEHYVGIRTCDGYRVGRHIMEKCYQVVFNPLSYDTFEEAALVLCELVRGMDDWAQERPNAERIPVQILVDEAGTWLPQEGGLISVSKATQSGLHRTFFGTIVNRGRSNGWGLILANQRIQGINKAALQAPWKFLFYQTQKVDVDTYKGFGLQAEDVMALEVGECFIFSPQVIGFRTHIREQSSPSQGHTPGLEQLLAYRQKLRPVQTSRFEELEHPSYGEEERHYTPQPVSVQQQPEPTELDRAIKAYQDGANSIGKLAARLEVSPWTARQLMDEMKVKDLV